MVTAHQLGGAVCIVIMVAVLVLVALITRPWNLGRKSR